MTLLMIWLDKAVSSQKYCCVLAPYIRKEKRHPEGCQWKTAQPLNIFQHLRRFLSFSKLIEQFLAILAHPSNIFSINLIKTSIVPFSWQSRLPQTDPKRDRGSFLGQPPDNKSNIEATPKEAQSATDESPVALVYFYQDCITSRIAS